MDQADDTNPLQARTATPFYVHVLAMAMVVLPCMAVSQFIAHWQVAVQDDHLFGFFGWRICGGATLYLDIWDNKPPAIYWINALGWLAGAGHYGGVIALCVLAQVLTCALFFVVAASVYERGTAALATGLAALYLTHGLLFAGTNRCETFQLPCELAAVAFYLRGFKSGHRWPWFAAGLCGGAAFLFKQTGLVVLGAMLIHLILLALFRETAWSANLKRAVLLLTGWGSIVGAAALCLAAQGALGEACFAVSAFNWQYLPPHERYWLESGWWSRWFDRYALSILRLPLLMAVAAVVHAGLWRFRPALRPPRVRDQLRPTAACPRTMTLWVLWYGLALTGALASPGSGGHHFLPTVPPLLLLSAYLINVLKAECSLLRRFAQSAAVLLAFLILGTFAADAVYLQFQKASKVWWDRNPRTENGKWTMDETAWERVGKDIARITKPDDKIQCWDYLPAVYLHARRPNACRFIMARYGDMKGPDGVSIDQTVLQTLQEDPPKIVVVAASTYLELRGADERDTTSPGRWLDAHYRQRESMTHENLYVFERKDSSASPVE